MDMFWTFSVYFTVICHSCKLDDNLYCPGPAEYLPCVALCFKVFLLRAGRFPPLQPNCFLRRRNKQIEEFNT